ncbi:hypothetical protein Ancab_005590 [Ancistrocladus abbreviatus]
MRTRSQTKRQKQSPGTLAEVSQDGIDKLLRLGNPSRTGRIRSQVREKRNNEVTSYALPNYQNAAGCPCTTSRSNLFGAYTSMWGSSLCKACSAGDTCCSADWSMWLFAGGESIA